MLLSTFGPIVQEQSMISLKFKSHSIKLTLNQLLDEVLTKFFYKLSFWSKICKFCHFQSTFGTTVQKLCMIWVISRSHMISLILIQLLGLVLTLENQKYGLYVLKTIFSLYFSPLCGPLCKMNFLGLINMS